MVNALLASVAVISALPMPGEDEARRFDVHFERAEAMYGRGDYGAAISLFKEADRLKVTPEVAFDLARSFEKLGDAAFTTLYDRLYLARAPDASDGADISQRLNRTLANEEEEGLSFVEIYAPGASSLTIAGRHFPAPPAALFLAPGEYTLEGTFRSEKKTLKVQVRLGRITSLWFEPVPPPLVAAGEPVADAALKVERPGPTPASPSGLRIASYVALGLGAAALAGGLVSGVLANGDAARAQDLALTVREARQSAADSNAKATAANVLFVAGGLTAATGGVLFFLSMPEPGRKSGDER
ncbi:MAG: hypothetical protein JNJ54_36050 [Myxococcaceae bacterium]|nr:hypothetical protein [Myxococcaceae bacterium]